MSESPDTKAFGCWPGWGQARRVLLHFDVGLLDQSAKALKLLPVELAELFNAQITRLTAQALEFCLHIGQLDDACKLRLKPGDHLRRRACRYKDTVPGAHVRAADAGFGQGWDIGNSALLWGVVTARALNLPALIWPIAEEVVSNMICTLPAMMSICACALPL